MNTSHYRLIIRNMFFIVLVTMFSSHVFAAQQKKSLIVFFSQPENVELDGVDGSSGASVIVKNNHILGATQYIARIIQQHIHGDLFRIETVKPYPRDHEPLIQYAEQEQKDHQHPALKAKPENIANYDVIYIGYPNWWYNMPMPIYSFFEQNDFSGKTIVPFNTHGGSGFSNSINEIRQLQPHANVISKGLAIPRGNVSDSDTEAKVIEWLDNLAL